MEAQSTEGQSTAEPAKPPKPFKVKRRTAEVIELSAKGEYAVFTIDQQPPRSYYGLSIESSFGGYSYAWGSPGGDFRGFLAQLNRDYVLGKMVGSDQVFDGEGTVKEIRKAIIERRKSGDCSREEARGEWPESYFDSEVDFDHWMNNTEMFKNDEPWFFGQTCGGSRTREFRALYDLFWPIFACVLSGWELVDEGFDGHNEQYRHPSGALVQKRSASVFDGQPEDLWAWWPAGAAQAGESICPKDRWKKTSYEAMKAAVPYGR